MISLVQFGINKHKKIFQRLTKLHEPVKGECNLGSLKNSQVFIYSKLHQKNHVITN